MCARNSNLAHNSLLFYELAKFLALPCLTLASLVYEGRAPAANPSASLALLRAGLALACAGGQLRAAGLATALVAEIAAAVFGAQAAAAVRQFAVTTAQLGGALALPQLGVALLAFLAVEAHGAQGMAAHEFRGAELALLLLSGGYSAVGVAARSEAPAAVAAAALALFRPPAEPLGRSARKAAGAVIAIAAAALFAVFDRSNTEIEERAKVMLLGEEEQIEPPVSLQVRGVQFQNAAIEHEE